MTKNKVVIEEIKSICKDLGVKVDEKIPTDKNKFLSAWNKGSTGISE